MEYLLEFKKYLLALKPIPSEVTVKNYVLDVKHFVSWFEESHSSIFNPKEITLTDFEDFKNQKSSQLSARSLDRHISSLRKFFYFLKLQGEVAASPFEEAKEKQTNIDPFHLKEFKDYLYVYNASNLTIKNYIIDLKQFISWLGETSTAESNAENPLEKISDQALASYRDQLIAKNQFSVASINRKLSSLRKYVSWAKSQNILENQSSLQDNLNIIPNVSSTFKPFVLNQERNESQQIQQPTKTHIGDMPSEGKLSSQQHLQARYSPFPPFRLFQKISKAIIFVFDSIFIAPLAHAGLKLKKTIWTIKGKPLFTNQPVKLADGTVVSVGVKNISKWAYNPAAISTKYFPWYRKAWHHARYTRPEWYKRYHSYTITHYFHWAILIIIMTAIGFGFYNNFVQKPQEGKPLLAATAPPRILSFQGRLTDINNTAISKATNLRFGIYTDQTSSGSALLWQEVDSVTPDANGVFSVLLGKNSSIQQSLFANNQNLYLGITVEQTAELTPRQQLATVAYATNAETLQGLPPITQSGAGTNNVVLALDSTGNLTIGAASKFQTVGGSFTLSGDTLVLNTNTGTNGNITLAPDGRGLIDLQKPLVNTSGGGNVAGSSGSVEIDDTLAILATSDAVPAETIEQDGAGALFTASQAGISKFTINNTGQIIASNYNTAGGIFYADGTGLFLQTSAGSTGQCLTSAGGGAPTWGTCGSGGSGTNFWTLTNGALYPVNTTLDVLFGGTASTSANFAFLNNTPGSGTPTASVSSGLNGTATYITANGTIQTSSFQGLTIGGPTTGNIVLKPLNGTGTVTFSGYTSGIIHSNGSGLLSSSAVNLTGATDITGILPLANGGTSNNLTADNGGIVYSDASKLQILAHASVAGQCLISGGLGAPSWENCSTASSNWWNVNQGAIYPINDTFDLLLGGGGATTSAKFAVLNMTGSGTPVASVSSGLNGFATYITANGTLQTTNFQGLTIGGPTTGNISLTPQGGTGFVTINGTINSNLIPTVTGTYNLGSPTNFWNNLYVNNIISGGNYSGFWQRFAGVVSPVNITDDLSIGGTSTGSARFQIFSNGNATTTGTLTFNTSGQLIQTTRDQGLTIGGDTTGNITLSPLNGAGTVTIDGVGLQTTASNFSLFTAGVTNLSLGTTGQTTTVNSGLTITGTITPNGQIAGSLVPTAADTYNLGSPTNEWNNLYVRNIITGGNYDGFWQRFAGVISPINITDDLTIGGTSTGSARFQIFSNGNATTTGTLTFNSSGHLIQTTNNQGLTIGGDTTGNIALSPLNGAGTVTIDGVGLQTTASNFSAFTSGVTTLGLGTTGGTTTVNSALTVSGILTANNNVILGATSANTINPVGVFSGNLIPQSTSVNLGSLTNYFGSAYITNLFPSATSQYEGFWQLNGGALSPTNITNDLLIGATASQSARLHVYALGGTVPTASVSGQTSFATVVVNNDGIGDLFTASSSSLPRFTIGNNGTITDTAYEVSNGLLYGTTTGVIGQTNQGSAHTVLHGNGSGAPFFSAVDLTQDVTNVLPLANGGTNNSLVADNGGIVYSDATQLQILAHSNTLGQCLLSGGAAAPSWGDCTLGGGINWWNVNSGAISPINTTLDLLIGGTATNSAKFAVLHVDPGTGTPTASVSSGLNGTAAYITADGTLQTTNFQGLTIGGPTTGNISLAPQGGTGTVTVNGQIASSLIPSVTDTFDLGSPTNYWNNLYVNNIISGGTYSGFFQRNLGVISPTNVTDDLAIGGTATSTAKFQVFGNTGSATTSGTLTFAGGSANNVIATRDNQGLTIGDNQTGNITLTALNGAAGSTINLNAATIATNQTSINLFGSATSINLGDLATTLNLANNALNTTVNIGGTSGTTTVNNALTVTGTSTLNGNTILGANNTKTITANGEFNSSLIPSATNTYDLGTSSLEWNNLYVNNIISGGNYSGFWQRFAGVISPVNITDDLSIGGTATSTAKFQVFGNTGSATTSGTLTFAGGSANNVIATRDNQGLTIGDNQTGNITLNPQGGTGTVTVNGLGTGVVHSNSGVLSSSTVNLNNGSTDISGTLATGNGGTGLNTYVQGDLLFYNTGTSLSRLGIGGTDTVLTSTGTGPQWSSSLNLGGSLTVAGSTNLNGNTTLGNANTDTITYVGEVNSDILPASNNLYNLGSSTNQWNNLYVNNVISTGTYSGFWQRNLGAISPANITDDILGGGTATNSAKFAVLNLTGNGTPTASVSSGLNGVGTYLTANGTLQTTNFQGLTIGGPTTGNISLTPQGGTGTVTVNGIGTGVVHSNAGVLSSSAVALGSSDVSGILPLNHGGTNNSLTADNGGIVYSDATQLQILAHSPSTGKCLLSGGAGAPTWGDCTLGGGLNWWNVNSGTISPINETLDVLVGGTSTASAEFSVLHVDPGTGTPTASVSSGLNGTGTFITANGTVQTTSNQGLTIGGTSTGNITLNPLGGIAGSSVTFAGASSFTSGTGLTTLGGNLTVNGTTVSIGNGSASSIQTSNANLNLNTGSGILTLNSGGSGNIQFFSGSNTLTSGGNLTLAGTITLPNSNTLTGISNAVQFTNGATFNSAGASGTHTNIDTSGNILPGTDGSANLGSAAVNWNNVYAKNLFLPSSGGYGGFWQLNNGALSPTNITNDLLLGATSSTSAKFAVLNIANGTPTASVSSGLNGFATYITANGTLQTTNFQGLTIGGPTTGNISLTPQNGTGSVTVNGFIASDLVPSQTDTYNLGSPTNEWNNIYVKNIISTGSYSGFWQRNFGTLSPVNITDDILGGGTSTASAKFAVLNMTGSGTPTASVSSGLNGVGTYITANGTLQTTNFQGLTIGGPTTGNITVSPLGGGAGSLLNLNAAIIATNQTSLNLFNTTATSINFGGAATTLSLGAGAATTLNLNGTTIATNQTSLNLFNTTATSINFAGAATTANAFINGTTIHFGDSAASNTISIGGAAGTTTVNNALTVTGVLTASNNVTLGTNGTNTITANGEFNTSLIPQTTNTYDLGTSSLTWRNLYLSNTATYGGFWQQFNGALSPINSTNDLLVGSAATTSAKFAVLGIANGTPTASVSSGLNGTGMYFDANGNLQTVRDETLTLGGTTTGNIKFASYVSSNIIPYLNNAYDLGSNPNLGGNEWNNVYANNVIVNGQPLSQTWQENLGALSPLHISDDVLIGGTATSTAKFAFINASGPGNPTASISGNLSLVVPSGATPANTLNLLNGGSLGIYNSAGGDTGLGTNPALYVSKSGSIGIGTTTPSGDLYITDSATGGTQLKLENRDTGGHLYKMISTGSGNGITAGYFTISDETTNTTRLAISPIGGVGIGISTPVLGNAQFVVNQTNTSGLGDLLTASASGTTEFVIKNNGNVGIGPGLVTPQGALDVASSGPLLPSDLTVGQNAGTNLIANPSFEYSGNQTNTWTFNRIPEFAASNPATESAEFGSHALKMDSSQDTGATFTATSGCVPVLGSTTYTASAFINVRSGFIGNIGINFQTYTNRDCSAGNATTGRVNTATTGQWTRVISTITTAATVASVKVQWIADSSSTGVAYLDGVQLEQAATASPYMDGSLGPGYTWDRTGTPNATDSSRLQGAVFAYQTLNSAAGIGAASRGSQATLRLDQDGTGNIINASASGIGKFIITNSGTLAVGDNITGASILANTGIDVRKDSGGNSLTLFKQLSTDTAADIIAASNSAGLNEFRLTNTGVIQARSFQDLDSPAYFLDPAASGNSLIISGTIGVGTLNPAPLSGMEIYKNSEGDAALIVADWDPANIGDLFTASNSAGTQFTIKNDGTLIAKKYTTQYGLLYMNDASGTVAETAQGATHTVLHGNGVGSPPSFSAVSLTQDVSGILPLANGGTNDNITADNGAVVYSDSSKLTLLASTATAGQCLVSGSHAAPSWAGCALGGGSNWWTVASGALYPVNTTLDMLIGGTSTASAKFAVLNMTGSGTPTASVSSGLNGNGTFITADGTLQTTNFQGLTIGGPTTGNIILSPQGGTGVLESSGTSFTAFDTTTSLTLGAATGTTTFASDIDSSKATLALLATPTTVNEGGVGKTFNVLGNFTAGALSADLVPTGNGAINLGSPTHYYGTVYANTFSSPVGGGVSGYWQLTNSVLSPTNPWNDLAVGGNATGSATPFQVFATSDGGVNVAGTATTSGNLTFRGSTASHTTFKVNILNGADLAFYPSVGGDTNTPTLTISNNGNLAVVGDINQTGNITSSGNVAVNGGNITTTAATGNIFTSSATTINLGTTATTAVNIGNASGGNLIRGNLTIGSVNTNTVNIIGKFISDLTPNATNTFNLGTNALAWQNLYLAGNYGGFWQRFNGTVEPYNITDDLLLGGTSTTSALIKFAGQANGDSWFNTGGNVAIGTTNPAYRLQVQQVAGSNTSVARFYGDHTAVTPAQFEIDGITNTNQQLIIGYNTNSNYGSIQAVLQGTSFEPLAIQGNGGTVGIGTTSPLATLDVRGNSGTTPIASFSGTTNQPALVIDNSGTGKFLSINSSNKNIFSIDSSGNLIPGATDTYNLGSDPNASGNEWNNLYVRQIFTSSSGGIAGYWQLNNGAISPTNITNDVLVGGLATASATFHVYGASATQGTNPVASISAHTSYAGLVVDNTVGDLITASSSGQDRFVVKQNGNVGIGIDSPANTLQVAGDLQVGKDTTNWGVSGYSYRRQVSITNTSGGALSNYQVQLIVDTKTLISAGKIKSSSCNDIRFTDTDGATNLPYWIENGCNTNYTTIWVEVPTIGFPNKIIYMYYGNSGATAGTYPTGPSPFVDVLSGVNAAYRLDEPTYDPIVDYSGNGNVATASGTTVTTGKFNKGRSFNGSSDYIEASDSASLQLATPMSVGIWFKTSVTGTGKQLIQKETTTGTRYEYGMYVSSNNHVRAEYYNGADFTTESTNTYTDGNWHYALMSISGTSMYLSVDNHAEKPTTITGTQAAPTGALDIGAHPPGPSGVNRSAFFSGTLDEARVYNASMSAQQAQELYGNGGNNYGYVSTNNPGNEEIMSYSSTPPGTYLDPEQSALQTVPSFYVSTLGNVAIGTPTVASSSALLTVAGDIKSGLYDTAPWSTTFTGWSYRARVLVDNTKSSTDLTNYIVQVTTNTAAPIANGKMRSDCGDLRFVDADNNTTLSYWIETNTCNTTSTVINVKVPTIPGSASKNIYMYYGKADRGSTSSTGIYTQVTSSNMKAGWRFDETSGTTLTDYSGNGNNGTINGTVIQGGIANNSRYFNGTASDYITMGNPNSLKITGALSLEAWVRTSGVIAYGGIISKMGTGAGAYGYTLRENSAGKMEFGISTDGTAFVSVLGTTLINDGKWHHVVGVFTPSTSLQIYIDGVLQNTNSTSIPATIFNTTGSVIIGCTYSTPTECFNGNIDEAKIYNISLTSTNVTNLYGNGSGYGYMTLNSGQKVYIRTFNNPEPVTSVDSEQDQSQVDPTLYVNNTFQRVGIGTANPVEALDVIGSVKAEGVSNPRLVIFSNLSGGHQYEWYGDGGGNPADLGLYDRTTGQYDLMIDGTGNVGIGTTTPNALLELTQSVPTSTEQTMLQINSVNGSTGNGGGILWTNNGDTNQMAMIAGEDSGGWGGNLIFATKTNTGNSSGSPSEKMRITNGGTVGIGSTNPNTTYALDVNGLIQGSAFYDRDDNTYFIDPASSGTAGEFNGSIGIGTTSPNAKLDVYSALRVSNSSSNYLALSTDGVNSAITNSVGATLFYNHVGTSGTSLAYDLHVTTSDTDALSILNNGYVGIGTTNPQTKLDVTGPGNAFGNDAYRFYDNSRTGYIFGQYVSSGTNAPYGRLGAYNGGFQNLALEDGGGKVGIGTTGPVDQFNVVGNAGGCTWDSDNGCLQGLFAGSGNTERLAVGADTSRGTGVIQAAHFGVGSETLELNPQGGMVWINTYTYTGAARSLVVGGNGCAFVGSFTCADYAESYQASEIMDPADIVTLDAASASGKLVMKSRQAYDTKLIGVVSTTPAVVINEGNIGFGAQTQQDAITKSSTTPPVALAGRVPVKVSTINGALHIGDEITSSQLPGFGMKALQAGAVIGKLMQDFDPANGNIANGVIPCPDGTPGNVICGEAFVFVNTSWYDPDIFITSTGAYSINDINASNSDFTTPHYYTLNDALGNPISRMGAFLELAVGNLRVGSVNAQQVLTNSLAVATENVSIAGQSLHDYIAGVVNEVLQSNQITINSPIASIDQLHTNLISPLASDSAIAVDLTGSQFTIRNNASGSAVASIDNTGNATFSGTLNSQNLAVNSDATISGTLHVGKIVADDIEGLTSNVGTLSAQNITNVTNIYFSSGSANQSGENFAMGQGTGSSTNSGVLTPFLGYTNLASYSGFLAYVPNLSADTAMFNQGLVSTGTTSLGDTTITGQLSIGAQLILADNSVNVLGGTFDIQPLRQGGVNFEGGLLAIDTDGNLTVNGDAVFSKTLSANIISPISNDRDLTLKLGENPNASGAALATSNLNVVNASGSGIFTIDQLGNFIASGAANIGKLNLSVAQPALAVSDTEVIATGSAGTTVVKAHQTEITIDNPLVTSKSLIYITPVGQSSVTPYLLRQVDKTSFTVGIPTSEYTDTSFNWLIVN